MLIAEHLWSIALVTILTSPHFNKLLLNCFICSNVLSLFVLFRPKKTGINIKSVGFYEAIACFQLKFVVKKLAQCSVRHLKTSIKSSAIQTSGRAAATVCSHRSFPCSTEITFHLILFAQSCTGTDLMVWRNTWEMWVSPTHWTPPRQPMKQIQNEQHFAWGWNGYTQGTTYTLYKNF